MSTATSCVVDGATGSGALVVVDEGLLEDDDEDDEEGTVGDAAGLELLPDDEAASGSDEASGSVGDDVPAGSLPVHPARMRQATRTATWARMQQQAPGPVMDFAPPGRLVTKRRPPSEPTAPRPRREGRPRRPAPRTPRRTSTAH